MLIAIDLDHVLVDLLPHLLGFYNQAYQTSYRAEDIKRYSLWQTWGISQEENEQRLGSFFQSPAFDEALPVEGAVEGIDFLSQKHELVAVTSRVEELKERTEKWMEKHFPKKFSKVFLTSEVFKSRAVKTKADLCQELEVDLVIEDCLEYAEDCARKGAKVLLMDCPWNQAESLPEGVERVHSWGEIMEKINKLSFSAE